MPQTAAIVSITIPGLDRIGDLGVWYYVICAVVFTVSGLIVGYFIWRKGHMQTLDAESEIRRTADELSRLREDLQVEKEGLR